MENSDLEMITRCSGKNSCKSGDIFLHKLKSKSTCLCAIKYEWYTKLNPHIRASKWCKNELFIFIRTREAF
jgi:hypothetical protein